MPRFKRVNLNDILAPAKEIEYKEPIVEYKESKPDERLDRLEIAVADMVLSTKGLKEVVSLLKTIASKEYPKFPDIPETKFPDIQKVMVENQEKIDLTEIKGLLSKVVSLLSKKEKIQTSTIVIQAPPESNEMPKETSEDTAHASQVNVRTRAKSRLITEVPTGTINGTNTTFFLSRAPRYNTQVFLFRNGAYQTDKGVDYTITGNKIVYNTPMQSDRGDGNPEQHYVLIFQS